MQVSGISSLHGVNASQEHTPWRERLTHVLKLLLCMPATFETTHSVLCALQPSRIGRCVQTLVLAALLAQPAFCNLHHLSPTHTRTKLSHGACVPPNGLFSKLGKIITPGEQNVKSSASDCAAACEWVTLPPFHCFSGALNVDELSSALRGLSSRVYLSVRNSSLP